MTKTGDVLYHYKWADPQFVDLSIGNTAAPGTVAAWLRIIACHDELRTPMIAKSNLTSPDLISLASTSNGDEDIFYLPITNEMKDGHDVTPIMILQWHEDKKLTDLILKDAMLDEVPKSKYQVGRIKIDCIERKVSFSKWELYDDEKRWFGFR